MNDTADAYRVIRATGHQLDLLSTAAADVLIAAGMISARPSNEAELLMFLEEFAAHLRAKRTP